MPRLAPTIDNSCTKMATWNPFIPENYPFRPINIKTAPTTGLKWPPRAALDCQIWQFEVHTLNGRSGFFHSNQGLKVFPSWRQDCPLPPPINRSKFHVRSKRKIEWKVDKKSAFLPCFYPFLPSPSQPHFRPPPPLSPPSFPLQPTSHSNTQQPCMVAAPPLSLSPSLSLFPVKHFSPFTTATPAAVATTISSSFHLYQQQRRRWLSSHPLQPPATAASTVTAAALATRAAATPAAQLPTVATAYTTSSSSVGPPSLQVTFLFLFLFPSLFFFFFMLFTAWTVGVNYNSCPLLMQWMLGLAVSGPAQMSGLGSTRP